MKLKPVVDTTGALLGYAFRCPGCEHTHVVRGLQRAGV